MNKISYNKETKSFSKEIIDSNEQKDFSISILTPKSEKQKVLVEYLKSRGFGKDIVCFLNVSGDISNLDKQKLNIESDLYEFLISELPKLKLPKDEYLIIPVLKSRIDKKYQILFYFDTNKISKKSDADRKTFNYSYHGDERFKSLILVTERGKLVDDQYVKESLIH